MSKALEAACGCDLTMLAYHYGSKKAESGLHRRFAKIRKKGEWFEAADEIFEAAKLHHDHGIVRVCKKYRVRL